MIYDRHLDGRKRIEHAQHRDKQSMNHWQTSPVIWPAASTARTGDGLSDDDQGLMGREYREWTPQDHQGSTQYPLEKKVIFSESWSLI
jgi:hypothetical protein